MSGGKNLHFTGPPAKSRSPLLANLDLSFLFPEERLSQRQNFETKGFS